MEKTLAVLFFLAIILAPAMVPAMTQEGTAAEPVADIATKVAVPDGGAGEMPPYYNTYFYISINEKFMLGDKAEAQLCGQGLATVELYRFEDFSKLLNRYSYYGDNADEFLKGQTPFKTLTVQLGDGRECQKADLQIEQAGLYFIKGHSTESDNKPTAFFSVEEIAFMAKESPEKIVFYAVDIKTGKPISGAEIKMLQQKSNSTPEQKPEITETSLGFTNDSGLFEWQQEKPSSTDYYQRIFIAKKDNSFAYVQSYYYGGENAERKQVYLFTDRPIYRPNQEVHFKGIIWETGTGSQAVAGETLSVTIRDAKWNEVFKGEFTTNEFGSFEGTFTLADEPPLGSYYIEATKGQMQEATANYYSGSISFQVQEYRKPEFEVTVNPSKDVFIGGEKARVEIKAEYLFKAPVQNAKVLYRVYSSYYQSPCYGYWKCVYYDEMAVSPYSSYMPYPYYGGQQLVTEGETTTDSEGKAFIEFDTNADREKRYQIEATVVDESNREVKGTGQITVAPAMFRLTVMPDKWWYAENEEVLLKISVADFEGKAVETAATVKVFSLAWNTNSLDYERTLVKEETASTSEGKAEIRLTLPTGNYAVEASAQDSKGNTVKAENSFSVSSYESESKVKEIEATLDRDYYLPGESAVLTITMPEAGYYALISVEGKKLFQYEAAYSAEQTLSYIIPVSADYEPNAFVSVTGMQGGKVFSKQLPLNVPPTEKKIDLSIETDADYYRPGGKAHYIVKATSGGQPVEAEFAVMLVDEAIYQLAQDNKEDIFKFFFAPEYNRVNTQWSVGGYYGPYLYNSRAMGGGGMEEMALPSAAKDATGQAPADGGYAVAEIRKTFADTAFWKAFLKTNSTGTAEFDVDLPDNLTTWRATVIANSQTKAGAQEGKIAVTKDLLARLVLPRFAVKGDEFTVTAIVHNSLPEMKNVLVKIESDNLEFPDGNEIEITVASGKSEKAEFKAIAKKCCSATIKLEALTDVESDGLEIVMPVLPWGIKEFETLSGEISNATKEITIEIPEETDREADRLIIKLSPTLAASIVDSLDYLTGYPYGCVEQTMSKFLPDVVVSETLKELGLENEKISKDLPDMVEKGLQRLYSFQHSDGGWGWWENDESQPFMTAYAMYGLTLAKKAGFNVEESVMEKGLQAMREKFHEAGTKGYSDEFDSQAEKDLEVQAFMSYVLYLNGDSKFVEEMKGKQGEMSDYGLALLALQAESKEEAQPFLDSIAKNASCDAAFCSWQGKSWRHYWSERDMESTAMVLKALVKWQPESEQARKAVAWLMSKKQYNHWNSTQDTATAIMAITDYLKYSGELDPNFTARVYINNELKKEFSVTKENLMTVDGSLEIEMPEKQSNVRIEMSGKGKLYYSITKEYFAKQEKIEAKSNGIKIIREVKSTLDIGEEATVKLTIEADKEYDYVIVEDFLPAGVSIVDTWQRNNYGHYYWDWMPYWYSRLEARDEKAVFFFNSLQKGETTLEYTVRAEVSGTFGHLPAQAYSMYNPEINGHSEGGIFTVTTEKSFSLPKLEVHDGYIWIYPRPIPMEETVKATVLDASGNTVASASGQAADGKIAIPLSAGLANGTYSVSVSTAGGTATKDFQVGTVTIPKAELASAAYSNELLDRTAQPALSNPAQAMCSSTGGSWAGGKCSCPAESYWIFGIGCQAKIAGGGTAIEGLSTLQIAVLAAALGAIILVFALFLGAKPEGKTAAAEAPKKEKSAKWKYKK
ncbi:MAG: MG2 domain-containing protein [Candidatus Diapherotrites archaeon]